MADSTKVWLITGSSTGFGRALTEAVLEKGYRVVATARKPEQLSDLLDHYPGQVKTIRLDVTNLQEVREAIDAAIDEYDRIDVLVNNAGFGTMGAIEEVSDDDIRYQYETNVFGVLNMTRAVLPQMRKQRSGHILNISSVGGFVSFAGTGIYCSTKFAVEGISEALAKEVAPLGIKVTIIEPGSFRTDFAGRSLKLADTQIDDYEETIGQFRQWIQKLDNNQPGDPIKAAQAMIQAVESDNPPLRLALGEDAVKAIETKLTSVKAELDEWKDVAINTAYEGVTAGAIGG